MPGGTEKIAGLWFVKGVSVPRLRCTTRGDGGGRPSLLFFENQKKCTDFFKKGLIVSILGFNLPFKM